MNIKAIHAKMLLANYKTKCVSTKNTIVKQESEITDFSTANYVELSWLHFVRGEKDGIQLIEKPQESLFSKTC